MLILNNRMKMKLFLCVLLLQGSMLMAQNKTDASLFLRSDSTAYLNEVSSETGDLYRALGHHGPAIENEWIGIRYYFDKKAAIDIKPNIRDSKASFVLGSPLTITDSG